MSPGRDGRPVVFFGELGTANLGNEGSLDVLVAELRRRRPDLPMRALCYHPEVVEARLGIPGEAMNGARPARTPRPLLPAVKLLWRAGDLARAWRQVGGARCVIVPGAGVFEGMFGPKAAGLPLAFWRTAVACRLRRVPLLVVGVGASAVEEGLSRRLFAAGLRAAAYVSYRDQGSLDCVRAWLGDAAHGELGADLAFGLPVPATLPVDELPEDAPVAVGVMAGGGVRDGRAADAHRQAVADLVRGLVDAGRPVRLVVGDAGDAFMAAEVRDLVGSDRVEVHLSTSLTELAESLAPCAAVVGTRFHNVVLAVHLGKPTVALSYGRKTTELMEAVGLGGLCLDAGRPDGQELRRLVDVALRERPVPKAEALAATADLLREDLDRVWARVAAS